MNEQTVQVTQGGALGTSALMLGNMVPSFTGDATGPNIRDFFQMLEQVGRLGGWQDNQLIGIARCKMQGPAQDFAWRDENVSAATAFAEFKSLALKRFDTEPISSKVERFFNARQNAGEEVRSFANRVRMLGTATLADVSAEDSAKVQMRREILSGQMLSQFLTGLRDPVRRFVLSRDPKTFDEAIEVAAKEEINEKVSQNRTIAVRHVEEAAGMPEMRSRLDRLEKLLEESLRIRDTERETRQTRPTRPPPPSRCYNCGGFGHFWRDCGRSRRRPWNNRSDRDMPESRKNEETAARTPDQGN